MKKLLFGLCFGLAGCVVSVTQQEIAAAHFGAPPKNYEKAVRGLMNNRLHQPEAAKYRFVRPAKGFGMVGGQKRFGWIVKTYITAKNNEGKYIGEVTYYFLFAEGKSWDATDLFNLGRAKFIDPPKE